MVRGLDLLIDFANVCAVGPFYIIRWGKKRQTELSGDRSRSSVSLLKDMGF